jgi:hypothetical protein
MQTWLTFVFFLSSSSSSSSSFRSFLSFFPLSFLVLFGTERHARHSAARHCFFSLFFSSLLFSSPFFLCCVCTQYPACGSYQKPVSCSGSTCMPVFGSSFFFALRACFMPGMIMAGHMPPSVCLSLSRARALSLSLSLSLFCTTGHITKPVHAYVEQRQQGERCRRSL